LAHVLDDGRSSRGLAHVIRLVKSRHGDLFLGSLKAGLEWGILGIVPLLRTVWLHYR
jgi:hypothetical protein